MASLEAKSVDRDEVPAMKRKRRFFGLGTLVATMLLAILWILVAVPSQHISANSNIAIVGSNRWQGEETLDLFGWPYVHASRLSVADKISNHFGGVSGDNPSGPSVERLEACLENATWWTGVYQLESVTPRPELMPAQVIQTGRGNSFNDKFWSSPEAWNYSTNVNSSMNSLIQWHPKALAINAVLFLCYLAVIALVLEFLARRRKRWWQFSLADFLATVGVIGTIAALTVSEVSFGKQQVALAEKLNLEYNIETRSAIHAPVLLTRLFRDNEAKWLSYFGAEGAFRRITHLTVTCEVEEFEQRDFLAIKELLNKANLSHVTHYSLRLLDPAHFDLVDSIPASNVKSIKLKYFWQDPQPAPSLKNLERFPQLLHLELENHVGFSSELPALPNLISLNVTAEENPEKLVKWLPSLTALESIWLDTTGAPGPILAALPTTIEFMHLNPKRSQTIDLSELARLKNLTEISMYSGSRQTITTAPELPSLKHFFLQGFSVAEDVPQQWRENASPQ